MLQHRDMNVNGELTALGVRHFTDKAYYHNFTPIYERFLFDKRANIQTMVEVGVLNGSSIKMWEEYLPTAEIYGLDINPQGFAKQTFGPRVHLELCDASDPAQLAACFQKHGIAKNSIDLFIEDGSHRVSEQVATVAAAWEYIKPGGIYVIEDVHTAVPSLIGRHGHIPHDGGYINMNPPTETRILGTMYGFDGLFQNLPASEIEHIAYCSNVKTMSLTCILTKKI